MALDSDERFTSARTAQGLVYTPPTGVAGLTPSERANARVEEHRAAVTGSAHEKVLAQLTHALESGSITEQQFAEMKDRMLGG